MHLLSPTNTPWCELMNRSLPVGVTRRLTVGLFFSQQQRDNRLEEKKKQQNNESAICLCVTRQKVSRQRREAPS